MPRKSTATLDTVALMTAEQARELRKLAHDAYELDAFSPRLTCAEAAQRIAILTAKLRLLNEPPHTR